MNRAKALGTLAATALMALAPLAQAADGRDDWPEGSAMHTLYVVGDELEATRAALSSAHGRLLAALDGAGRDAPLARAIALHHERWLAYRDADCELAGELTGAGGAWPSVHGISCRIEHLGTRTTEVDAASSCLQELPSDGPTDAQRDCLRDLVDWAMQGN